jgi:glycosyltransferase involved in cell wall biosynthesis
MSKQASKIGLVGPLPPPNGGMAMQTLQLSKLLSGEGISIELLQTNAPYKPRLIEGVRGLRALFRLLPYLWKLWYLAGRVQLIHLMANSGWSWQLYAAPAIWIGWLRRTPVIVNYRGGEAREYFSRSLRVIRPTMSRATSRVVPSGFLHQVFAEHDFDTEIIPNIIDLNIFSPELSASSGENFTLVITRNLEAIYGLDTAIRAVAIAVKTLPGLELKIAGSGPLLEELQTLAKTLGVSERVQFLGRLERESIVALYREGDAMLNPSRVDNMPNSVLEALASGLPVISTNVGGVPYIVEDGKTALLVDADEPEAMAGAILRLHQDNALRTRLQKRGLDEVRQYAWPQVRDQWLSLYRRHGVAL